MTAASTVSTPPLSVTSLTTPASVMMMEIVMLKTSVTLRLENASSSPSVLMMLNVRDMTRSVTQTMTTASTAARMTVMPLMAVAQVRKKHKFHNFNHRWHNFYKILFKVYIKV